MRLPGEVLGPVTAELGGVQVGLVHASGCAVHLHSLTGWWDPPPVSGGVEQRAGQDGGWLMPSYLAARVIGMTVAIDGTESGEGLPLVRELIGALPVRGIVTELTITDEERSLSAWVLREGDPLVKRSGVRHLVSLSMVAPDPRRYGASAFVGTQLRRAASGGLVLPVTVPVSLGAMSSSGRVTVVNEGDTSAPALLLVVGPLPSGFTVTHLESSRALTSADPLQEGRTLLVDLATRTARQDDVARVVTGSWFELAPGVNTIDFTAPVYDSTASLFVTYRSAWM